MTSASPTTSVSEVAEFQPGSNVILCADDFAITEGVSRGIEELARARRLSATSAIVNQPGWQKAAERLRSLRPFVAAGLHLNLTLGSPLGPTPGLAPDGEFPDNITLIQRCITGGIDTGEVASEIDRQLDRFEEGLGVQPDFIDGHQHVHALPRIRHALIDVLSRRYRHQRPLVRDPGDHALAILCRRTAAHKAMVISALAYGFGDKLRAAGFPTNHGFSGVSPFKLDIPFAKELAHFFTSRGPRHLVMCHPGYPDAALAELDPVVERRRHELDALFAAPRLDEAIWHPDPRTDRSPVDWARALPV
jgi:predicted glycoside hydrolase/deacetylase ChbG (UPF0249 family)